MGTARLRWRGGLAWLVVVGVALSGCPTQTSGDDDDDAISDDDVMGDDDVADGWEVLFEDDYERADGPLGSDYVALAWLGNEVLEIRDGEVFVDCEYFAVRWVEAIPDDTIRVMADLRYEQSGADGVQVAAVARYGEDLQGDFPSYDAFLDGAADELSLMRSLVSGEDGQLTVIDEQTVASAVEPDTVYHVTLTVDGGALAALYTDVAAGTTEELTLSDASPLAGGNAGIHGQISGDVVVYLDNLSIQRLIP